MHAERTNPTYRCNTILQPSQTTFFIIYTTTFIITILIIFILIIIPLHLHHTLITITTIIIGKQLLHFGNSLEFQIGNVNISRCDDISLGVVDIIGGCGDWTVESTVFGFDWVGL